MLHITKQHAKEVVHRYEGLKRRVAGMRQEAERITRQVVRTAEVGGTAFAVGLMQGRTDGIEIVGVPLELAVGGAATVVSLVGRGDYTEHLAAVGDGALAAYATTLGRGVGVTMRQKALMGVSAPQGQAFPASPQGGSLEGGATVKGASLTPEEIAEVAMANR